ncbi:MAG: DUF2330 domain-containing protein [Chloroflexi bacterium]|nr:DUF2330 domain-containing protein [Chloroflexota bacterium]
MRRLITAAGAATLVLLTAAGTTLACGGLIGPNGAVNLLRTTTFAGYHDGIEHYVTSFEFAGGGGAFGSIVPLPGVPSNVERGGDWTLQRLLRETEPVEDFGFERLSAASAAGESAEVLLETKIDALDITVLKGGGDQVGTWAKDHGFRLPPDAPEVLDFYAERSPIFLAASFDAAAAAERGQQLGDGTPVHVTVPTPNPWVPLRILGLGKNGQERIEADVYLLTDRKPVMLPVGRENGLLIEHNAPATELLLNDLRSDKGMEWIPESGWLTKIGVDATAAQLKHDLAIDASGQGQPSLVAAGMKLPGPAQAPVPTDNALALVLASSLLLIAAAVVGVRLGRPSITPAQ